MLHEYFDPEMPSNSISEYLFFKILGVCPQTPLALACYACLLYVAQWSIIPGSSSLLYALLSGIQYKFAPPVIHYISFRPPLTNILKEILIEGFRIAVSGLVYHDFWTINLS